jgi:hypothetical protein
MKVGKMICLFVGLLLLPLTSHAAQPGRSALVMNYTEVLVENFQPGVPYNMTQAVNLPLEITNEFDTKITVRIDRMIPPKDYVKKGFEPIPDIKWLELGQDKVDLEPMQTHKTDVRVTIPDNDKYLGKKYQVEIISTIIASNGKATMSSFSIEGRLLFTVAPVRQKFDMTKTDVNLNFNFIPAARIELKNFPLGYKVEITRDRKSVQLENLDGKVKLIGLQSIDPKTSVAVEPDCQPTDHPEWITFDTAEVSVDGNAKKPARIFLEIPDEPQYRNKRIYFIVAGVTGSGTVSRGLHYLRIVADTQKAMEEPKKETKAPKATAVKDDKATAVKDDKTVAVKDDKTVAVKDDKAAAAKNDKTIIKQDDSKPEIETKVEDK